MIPNSDDSDIDDTIDTGAPAPVQTPDALAIAFNLIALAADPRGFKKKLQGLHRALTAVDEGMARLAADRTAHDAHVAEATAELADREKKLRLRELQLAADRGRFDDTQKMIREGSAARDYRPLDDDGWTPPAGSGMSRTFAPPPRTVPSEEPPKQTRTIRVGRAGTTLAQEVEQP
jgi:hypothetical protein